MTKLVIVLAVVVVVILVVVFVAVRNMRAEDPDEFADRPQRRGGSRGGRDDRDLRYDRREPAERQPARAGRGDRSAARQGTNGHRPATARDFDERRDRRDDGYDQRGRSSRGYDEDGDVDRRRGRDDRRRAPVPSGSEERRRNGKGPQRRPEPGQARSRRSGDSSEWDSSEWEKLSDVDYWAELASDKPLTTTAQPAGQARPGRPPRADREADPAAVRAPRPASAGSAEAGLAEAGPAGAVPAGAPRRDPVTGLPVRGAPRPADAELATSAIPDAYGRADYAAAPVSAVAAEDQLRPLAEPRLPLPPHVGPDGPPRPARGAPPDRPPAHLDDDPLTSPSFPRIPASDSRSYHNGRTSTPAQGSRVPERYLPATEQFTSYGSPVSQRAARHTAPGDVGGDTDRTNPNSYLPDPLLNGHSYPASNGNPYPAANGDSYPVANGDSYPAANGDSYPARAAAAPSAPPPPAPAPAPAPSAPATSGNPYGSYVTSDSQDTALSYGDYPALPGNGHGSYLPSPVAGSTGRHSGTYRQQPTAPASVPRYPDGPVRARGRHGAGAQAADYRNGYGQQDQASSLPNGYPAGSRDPAGYGLQDPYGQDGYGGYPEYGPAEN
jgi:hypothetical protein